MAEYSNAQDYQNVSADVQVHSEDDFIATDCTSNTSTNADDSLPRCWQLDHKKLTACMHEVYKNKLWTDMTIHCGVNQEEPLQAHKIILAARSPVFEALLFGPCSEQKSEYMFPDADEKTFDNLLRYLYNDDVEFSDIEEAIELMQTAHMYQITSLEEFCADYLQTHITPEDACKILDIAIKLDYMDLRDTCCIFMDRNADDILESDDFLNISPECLKYILKSDTFWAKEGAIFFRVEEWAKRRLTQIGKEENGQNIRNVIGDVMYHIRLPTIQMEDISKCTRGKGYFTLTEFEDIIACHLGYQSHLSFMSNNPRIIPDPQIILQSGPFREVKCTEVRQTLLVGVKRTVCLKSLSICHFDVFLHYSSRLYTYNNGRYNKIDGQLMSNSLPVTLHVTVTVDQLDFKESFLMEQKKGDSELSLTKPLLLQKQQTPYKLEIEIKAVGSDNSIKLVGQKGTVEQTFLQWGEKKYISVSQAETQMLGVEWIEFTNCSFRENNDITNDRSELDAFLSDGDSENSEDVGDNSETSGEEFGLNISE